MDFHRQFYHVIRQINVMGINIYSFYARAMIDCHDISSNRTLEYKDAWHTAVRTLTVQRTGKT